MLLARVPLAKVAFASAIVYAITATVEMTLPAHLSTTAVAWLVKPWLGVYIFTFPPSSLPSAAMSVAGAALFLIVVAVYLDHCVVDQPLWAIAGGWAPMLSGLTLLQLQSAFGAWWVSVDINHSGFPLAYCEVFVGLVVVAGSWLVAPELFNPKVGRPWLVAIFIAILLVNLAQTALNAPRAVVDFVLVMTIGGGLLVGTLTEMRRLNPTDRSSPTVVR